MLTAPTPVWRAEGMLGGKVVPPPPMAGYHRVGNSGERGVSGGYRGMQGCFGMGV